MNKASIFTLICEMIALFLPVESLASHHKGRATVANTAILSLILVPPLALLLIFKLHKRNLNQKNIKNLKSLSRQQRRFDPENIKHAIESIIDVISSRSHLADKMLLQEYITSDLFSRYSKDNRVFDDYEKISLDIILAVEATASQNQSVVVAVTSFKKSRKGGRFNSGQSESWKLVERGDKWVLDAITDISVTDFY